MKGMGYAIEQDSDQLRRSDQLLHVDRRIVGIPSAIIGHKGADRNAQNRIVATE